jgi:hypothetical protein
MEKLHVGVIEKVPNGRAPLPLAVQYNSKAAFDGNMARADIDFLFTATQTG